MAVRKGQKHALRTKYECVLLNDDLKIILFTLAVLNMHLAEGNKSEDI